MAASPAYACGQQVTMSSLNYPMSVWHSLKHSYSLGENYLSVEDQLATTYSQYIKFQAKKHQVYTGENTEHSY